MSSGRVRRATSSTQSLRLFNVVLIVLSCAGGWGESRSPFPERAGIIPTRPRSAFPVRNSGRRNKNAAGSTDPAAQEAYVRRGSRGGCRAGPSRLDLPCFLGNLGCRPAGLLGGFLLGLRRFSLGRLLGGLHCLLAEVRDGALDDLTHVLGGVAEDGHGAAHVIDDARRGGRDQVRLGLHQRAQALGTGGGLQAGTGGVQRGLDRLGLVLDQLLGRLVRDVGQTQGHVGDPTDRGLALRDPVTGALDAVLGCGDHGFDPSTGVFRGAIENVLDTDVHWAPPRLLRCIIVALHNKPCQRACQASVRSETRITARVFRVYELPEILENNSTVKERRPGMGRACRRWPRDRVGLAQAGAGRTATLWPRSP